MVVEKSAPDWIGPVAFPWLFRLIVNAFSYRALSHHVLRVVFSCQFVELLAKIFGSSCANFRIATRFLDLESINHWCALLLSSPFSELLWAWTCALWSSDPPCRPCRFCALVNCTQKNCRNVVPLLVRPWPYFCKKRGQIPQLLPSFFHTTKISNFVRDLVQIKTFEMFPECEKFDLIPRWMAFAINYYAIQQWMNATLVWMRHNYMHKSSDVLFPTILLVLLRGRPRNLTSTSGLVVTSSATCFAVLSRRTCQTLWRVTLVAIVAITNPLIQNFVGSSTILPLFQKSWLAQSCWGWWHWNSIARMSNPVFWALFRLIQNRMHSGTHSNQFETVPLVES